MCRRRRRQTSGLWHCGPLIRPLGHSGMCLGRLVYARRDGGRLCGSQFMRKTRSQENGVWLDGEESGIVNAEGGLWVSAWCCFQRYKEVVTQTCPPIMLLALCATLKLPVLPLSHGRSHGPAPFHFPTGDIMLVPFNCSVVAWRVFRVCLRVASARVVVVVGGSCCWGEVNTRSCFASPCCWEIVLDPPQQQCVSVLFSIIF